MKKLLGGSLLFASICLPPQASALDPQSMQGMMAAMEQVQACMAGIDQQNLRRLEAKSNAINSELHALCKSGKRDEAQKRGLKYAKEITSDPDLIKMMACTKQLESAMAKMPEIPGMPAMPDMSFPEIDEGKHVCDQIDQNAR